MKYVSLDHFKSNMDEILRNVVIGSDIACVSYDKGRTFVVMSEPEYDTMRDALRFLMQNANKLPDELFEKLGRESGEEGGR